MEYFPRRLARLRNAKGLSQRELAEKCGWFGPEGKGSQTRVANYESEGESRREPTLAEIGRMAAVLEVSACYLAFGVDRAVETVAEEYELPVDIVKDALDLARRARRGPEEMPQRQKKRAP